MATRVLRTVLRVAAITAIVTAGVASSARPVRADALLDEIVGFTLAINKSDFGAAFTMGEFANELLETIAPR